MHVRELSLLGSICQSRAILFSVRPSNGQNATNRRLRQAWWAEGWYLTECRPVCVTGSDRVWELSTYILVWTEIAAYKGTSPWFRAPPSSKRTLRVNKLRIGPGYRDLVSMSAQCFDFAATVGFNLANSIGSVDRRLCGMKGKLLVERLQH